MALRLPDRPISKLEFMEQKPPCRAQIMRNTLTEVRAAITTQSHKRDQDEFLATSSDPPMFSSDPPVFTTSIDDYQQPSQKRQRRGPWYEMEEATELCMKKNRRRPGLRQAPRQRRPFRKFDSGVYMGSDESTASESSEPISTHDAPYTVTNSAANDEGGKSDVEDSEHEAFKLQQSTKSETLSEDQLFDKATQTVEDPGGYEGPVFPYWQEQPVHLRQFHVNQRLAQDKVLGCVDRGEEVVDLS